jgi:YebC/PmpR family DNA-binding regulatory protein
MAGHSQFKNIMHRKGAQDAKKAKLFTKLVREIIVACQKGQPDPEFNPRLRSAITAARRSGVARDKIEMAIKKGSGELTGEQYEEMRYEAYGPGGVAIIIEALTDNRNRTASDLRAIFSKHGGNLGESGSVNFMFERVGLVVFSAAVANADAMFEAAVMAGAENVESSADWHEVATAPDAMAIVRDALQKQFGEPESAKLAWIAKTEAPVDIESARAILKLVDALEDYDDVQEVFANYQMADDVAAQIISE